MVAPVVFLTGFKVGKICHHGRLNAVSLETASRDTQTLNLSQNVSKFYARQVASDDRAAKPKFVALSRPALCYSGQQVYRSR